MREGTHSEEEEGEYYENRNNHKTPLPNSTLTAPLMLHDCAYARKIKAYQNITLIFALCMREIAYDTLFDINCTFGRRKMKDSRAKLCNERNVFVFATSRD